MWFGQSMFVFVGVFSTKRDKKTFCQAVVSMWSSALWIQLICLFLCANVFCQFDSTKCSLQTSELLELTISFSKETFLSAGRQAAGKVTKARGEQRCYNEVSKRRYSCQHLGFEVMHRSEFVLILNLFPSCRHAEIQHFPSNTPFPCLSVLFSRGSNTWPGALAPAGRWDLARLMG